MAYTTPEGIVKMGAGAGTGAAAGSMLMPGIGTAVGAGLGLLGGFLSSESNSKSVEKQIAAQKEAAQHGIQWRVADAKAAGIHPLYAMGAPTVSMGAQIMPDQIGPALAQAGQDIGKTISSQATNKEKLVEALQIDMLTSQAQKAKAEAEMTSLQLYEKLDRSNTQNGLGLHNENETINPMGQVPQIRGTEIPGAAIKGFGESGFYERKAPGRNSPSASISSVESKALPGYQENELYPGFYFLSPAAQGESWAEQWNEMSFYSKLALMNFNANHYGANYFGDAWDVLMMGRLPKHKYRPLSETGGHPQVRRGQAGRELGKRLFGE